MGRLEHDGGRAARILRLAPAVRAEAPAIPGLETGELEHLKGHRQVVAALAREAPEDPGTLRKNVTSPGGTTAAALGVLMAPDGLTALMTKAMTAARDRGRELAKG